MSLFNRRSKVHKRLLQMEYETMMKMAMCENKEYHTYFPMTCRPITEDDLKKIIESNSVSKLLLVKDGITGIEGYLIKYKSEQDEIKFNFY